MKKVTLTFIVDDSIADEVQNELGWGEMGNAADFLNKHCEESDYDVNNAQSVSMWHDNLHEPQDRCVFIDVKHPSYDHFFAVGLVEHTDKGWHVKNSERLFQPEDIASWAYAMELKSLK